jgi:uncharacterized membrane protein
MNGPSVSGEQMLVHFYRAVVAHGDVWRQRMDATTNWAAATTAGMITVTFGVGAPHFVLLLALGFNVVFLLMESRRYRTYHLWRVRFNTLNRYLVAPVLDPSAGPDPEMRRSALADLARDLGRTAPDVHLYEAVGYRVHRNYGFIFGIVILAWAMKLVTAVPSPQTIAAFVEGAAVGPVPGVAVLAAVASFFAGAVVLALISPGERMMDWTEAPPPLHRWTGRGGPGGTGA